jgi:hypothetical protein
MSFDSSREKRSVRGAVVSFGQRMQKWQPGIPDSPAALPTLCQSLGKHQTKPEPHTKVTEST